METTAAAAPGAPASCCEIARLPEDLLSASFALAGPVAACRAAAVCHAFHDAADSDALWARFLPRDLPPFADLELSPSPTSKKALFMRLSNGPVLLADGFTSMCLHSETRAVCYMLSARKLSIAWGGDTPSQRWIPITGCRFSEAAQLHNFWWLEICGKIDSKMMSQRTTYTAYIVFKVDDDRSYMLHSLCQETSVSIGGRKFTQNVCLAGLDLGIVWVLLLHGDIPDDSKFPKERDDGWMELETGEFHNGEGEDGEVSINLNETSVVKSGLVVLGIEVRPKGLPSKSIACKPPTIWPAFHAPCHLPSLADGEVSAPLTSKKALFLRLLDGPVLLADGLTSLWLDRETGVMCYMLFARKLGIASGDTRTYWNWIPITRSRFSEAAQLHHSRWLEIRGKIDSKILSQHTTYVVYIVFKVDATLHGLDYPCQETSVTLGQSNLTHNVCLDGDFVRAWLMAMGGVIPEDTWTPDKRDDGWMEFKMGEFHNNEGEDGEVSISLTETSIVKSGLVVLGFEIRPKKERGPWE